MKFEEYKNKSIRKYENAKKKNLVDKDILNYLDEFNKLKNYYTTSSCSGRIMLVKNKIGQNKLPNSFYYKSHSTIDYDILMKHVLNYDDDFELWFKCESFILHIGCNTINDAKKLLNYCQLKGIKRAGIISLNKRIIVEISGTPNLFSIIYFNKKRVAKKEYIKLLTQKANMKLTESKEILYNFFKDSKKLK